MLRQFLIIALVGSLLANLYPQAPRSEKPSLKQRVLEIPAGTVVEVHLQDKQKLRGRIGEVSDEGFQLQHMRAGKLETRTISFAELKSIRTVEKIGGGRIALYVLAGVGVTFLILFAIAAALVDD